MIWKKFFLLHCPIVLLFSSNSCTLPRTPSQALLLIKPKYFRRRYVPPPRCLKNILHNVSNKWRESRARNWDLATPQSSGPLRCMWPRLTNNGGIYVCGGIMPSVSGTTITKAVVIEENGWSVQYWTDHPWKYNLRRPVMRAVLSTRIWGVPRLVGRYCSYLLPRQAAGTPQILVDKTSRMTGCLRVY